MKEKDIVDYVLKVEEISHVGLKYSKDPYALDNYECLEKLSKDFITSKFETPIKGPNFFSRDVYPTPSVSVRTIIFDEKREKILLVQEKMDMGWSLPGGWSEIGLTPSQSALKEVREEAGAEAEITRLVGVYDRYSSSRLCGVPEYIMVFEARIKEFVSDPCFEIAQRGYFALDKLPPWSKKNHGPQMEKIIEDARLNKTTFD